MKQRNGEIEILRLLFTFFVLLVHSGYATNAPVTLFRGGWIGVEFFFIVSGYLMAAAEDRMPRVSDPTKSVGPDTLGFMKDKLKGLLPYYLFALAVSFIVWKIPFHSTFLATAKQAVTASLNLVFPYSVGFSNQDYFYLGYSWYLSALVFSSLILFPLLRRDSKRFLYVIAPLIVMFGLGLYASRYQRLGFISQKDYLLSNGIIRGLAEVSLGCICYAVAKKLKSLKVTRLFSILLSAVEITGIAAVSILVIFSSGNLAIIEFVLLFILAICVTIAFSGKSATVVMFNGKASRFTGKFSYALYINSNCWHI